MKLEYCWKTGLRVSKGSGGGGVTVQKYVPPEVFGRVFTKVQEEKGIVRRTDILEEARDEESELHDAFLWDDTEAAEKYRLEQAGLLIRSIGVEVIDPNVDENGNYKEPDVVGYREVDEEIKFRVPACPRVKPTGESPGHRRIDTVFENPEDRDYVLQSCLNELRNIRKKWFGYCKFAEIHDACNHIDAAIQAVRSAIVK